MTQEHPITPPEDLLRQWCTYRNTHKTSDKFWRHIAIEAARWGADMELEACCKWLREDQNHGFGDNLRVARRPKPPSLKARGRKALQSIHNAVVMETGGRELDVLKEIVESLPD